MPSNNNLFVKVASIDLPVGLKSTSDMQSSSYYYTIGSIRSEEFGLSKIDLAATISPADTGYYWGNDVQLNNAYIELILSSVKTFKEGQEIGRASCRERV